MSVGEVCTILVPYCVWACTSRRRGHSLGECATDSIVGWPETVALHLGMGTLEEPSQQMDTPGDEVLYSSIAATYENLQGYCG